ncbi:DUF4262 domain-containing protein [Microbispora rosea]|uniref:DUF4262 domain-containing protein n=1 Tax=Microbispora rosea TaxID=58117 RepID=UPI003432E9AD
MSTDGPGCRCIVCHDYGDRDEWDAIDRHTVEHVRSRGWSVKMIPEDDLGPGFAYTVGLWHTYRSPDLAMFGLDVHLMHELLNRLGDDVATGEPVDAEQERRGLIARHPVVLKQVDVRWYREFFGQAIAFYRRPPFPVLEVVWPDPDGRFPWHPDYAEQYRELQPSLWLWPGDQGDPSWSH